MHCHVKDVVGRCCSVIYSERAAALIRTVVLTHSISQTNKHYPLDRISIRIHIDAANALLDTQYAGLREPFYLFGFHSALTTDSLCWLYSSCHAYSHR